ncbi:MAG TPA: Z-ring formation inhibitor MciZ [Chondromyces sp.]|nr:Z-ring formation inhibitor MciZ [Chondromyces sp.]
MKVYIGNGQVILSGKAWEIRHALKQYGKQFRTVQEWIQATPPRC